MDNNLFGLTNLNNICFMNSVLQLLCSSSDFLNEVENSGGDDFKGKSQLFKIIFSENGLPKAGSDICRLLVAYYSQDNEDYIFGRYMDAQEYYTYLFTRWEIKSLSVKIKKERSSILEPGVPRTADDDYTSFQMENFISLPMVTSSGEHLTNFDECLDNFLTEFPEDFGKPTVIRNTFEACGNQIVFGLKRFSYEFTPNGDFIMNKNKRRITMREDITLQINGQPVDFYLKAAIMHIEFSGGGKHYIMFKKVLDEWYAIDDSTIYKFENKDFECCYMYLYDRKIRI